MFDTSNNTNLFEIFVPAKFNDGKKIPIEHHEAFDKKVCDIVGGLTLQPAIFGKYQNAEKTFSDKIIPVRIACTHANIMAVAIIAAEHYDQESIYYWKVSDFVEIYKREPL